MKHDNLNVRTFGEEEDINYGGRSIKDLISSLE